MTFTKIMLKTAKFNLAVLLLLTIACTRDPNKTTTLKVTGVEPSMLIALKVYDTTGVIKAGADKKVKDNYQKFTFKANHPLVYIIESGKESFELIIQPGEEAEINIDATKTGTNLNNSNNDIVETRHALSLLNSMAIQQIALKTENQHHQEYLKRLRPLEIQADSLSYLFMASQATDSFALVRERVNQQFKSLVNEAKVISIEYIHNHGNSIGIFTALNKTIRKMPVFDYLDDWQYVLMTDSLLQKHHSDHPYSKWLDNHIKSMQFTMGDYVAETARIKPGTIIPEISLQTLDGKTVSVTPHPTGITLIHLWEDSPLSREVNKQVKLLHEKYSSDKFKLYSICFDTNIKRWSAAVTIDKMWWNNLIDIETERSQLLAQLNQPQLPSIIVVDNEMKVLGYFTSTRSLDNWTEQYFSSTSKKPLN